ncbi:hypothetical protein [Filimonas effusa]|uniref:Uncharacterized protein n=1 Tax=Filimonas effusa TaxID=2508721 RepID=A0A4Q1DC00_9BACT|nr:hypothetical protein [Filimonas effusa]RXK87024.1 hypothetical protein ESB13_09640 [Filimonas effusa]
MIPDKLFKALLHNCPGYETFLKGNSLEPGYKPDFVLKCKDDYIILESENSSSRKTFVGGMMKAAHFLQGTRTGMLIFVIVPKENTSVTAIARHLKSYLKWIEDKTNLRDVYVIAAEHYYDKKEVLMLGDTKFKKIAVRV